MEDGEEDEDDEEMEEEKDEKEEDEGETDEERPNMSGVLQLLDVRPRVASCVVLIVRSPGFQFMKFSVL